MATVYKRASAKRDLVEDYVYLAEHADFETAERFLASADESFRDLAQHPGMGTALSLHDPKLTGLRKWRVSGFEKFLIFYIPRADGVSIVRVLHAAQDWWGLLGILYAPFVVLASLINLRWGLNMKMYLSCLKVNPGNNLNRARHFFR